jgi:hypothetical protein
MPSEGEGVWDVAGSREGKRDRAGERQQARGRAMPSEREDAERREMPGPRNAPRDGRRGRVVPREGEGMGDEAGRGESTRDRVVPAEREAGREMTGGRTTRRGRVVSREGEGVGDGAHRRESARDRVEEQQEAGRTVPPPGRGEGRDAGRRRKVTGGRGAERDDACEPLVSRPREDSRDEMGLRGVEPKGGVERAVSGEGEGVRGEAGRRRAARERAASRRREAAAQDQAEAEAGAREGSRPLGPIFPPREAAEIEVVPVVDSPGGHASAAFDAGAVASSLADTLPADQAELRNALDLLLRYAARIEGGETAAPATAAEPKPCDGKPFGIAAEPSGDP